MCHTFPIRSQFLAVQAWKEKFPAFKYIGPPPDFHKKSAQGTCLYWTVMLPQLLLVLQCNFVGVCCKSDAHCTHKMQHCTHYKLEKWCTHWEEEATKVHSIDWSGLTCITSHLSAIALIGLKCKQQALPCQQSYTNTKTQIHKNPNTQISKYTNTGYDELGQNAKERVLQSPVLQSSSQHISHHHNLLSKRHQIESVQLFRPNFCQYNFEDPILPISMRIGECHSGMFLVCNFEDP